MRDLKRTGFKPKGFTPRPAKEIAYTPRPRAAAACAGPSTALIKPAPKTPPDRLKAYRDMAQNKPCMLQLPRVCNRDWSTTVLAHANTAAAGKGMGLKASDSSGVWACYSCHSWLDQGKAPAAQKKAAMEAACERQVAAITEIANHGRGRDRETAQWALDVIRRAQELRSAPAA